MYRIIKLISFVVRQVYLPNPFITIIENNIYAFLVNALVGEAVINMLSYGITSIYYRKSEMPALGSASYMVWYIINTFIFIGVGYLTTSIKIYIMSLIIIYVALFTFINCINGRNKFNY